MIWYLIVCLGGGGSSTAFAQCLPAQPIATREGCLFVGEGYRAAEVAGRTVRIQCRGVRK